MSLGFTKKEEKKRKVYYINHHHITVTLVSRYHVLVLSLCARSNLRFAPEVQKFREENMVSEVLYLAVTISCLSSYHHHALCARNLRFAP